MDNYILNQAYAAPFWLILAGNSARRAYEDIKLIGKDKTKIAAAVFDSANALMTGAMFAVSAWNGLEKLISQLAQ